MVQSTALLQTVYTDHDSVCGGVGQAGATTFEWRVVASSAGQMPEVFVDDAISFKVSHKASNNVRQLASVFRGTFTAMSKRQSKDAAWQLWQVVKRCRERCGSTPTADV